MPLLPSELLIKIGRILPPISAKRFSGALGPDLIDEDREIWGAIFNDEKYATKVTAMGLDLILFGADLQRSHGSNTNILLTYTYIGEKIIGLWKYKELFLASLKPHKLYKDGHIQLRGLSPGSTITLFTAGDILSDKQRTDVLELRGLFAKEHGIIQSAYLNWNGHKCVQVGRSHIAGASGKTATLDDVSNVCMVQLPKIPKKEGHLLFLRSDFPIAEKLSVLAESLEIYAVEGYPWKSLFNL